MKITDPIESYEQAEQAIKDGHRVELASIDQHACVAEWSEPAPGQDLRNFPLERWRIRWNSPEGYTNEDLRGFLRRLRSNLTATT